MDSPQTKYVVVDDAEVAYQVIGDGPIDLVYHHGLCHIDLQWDTVAESTFNRSLAAFSRLILFDRRGSGASERAGQTDLPTWEKWTGDFLAVLDAVESEQAAIFVEAEAGAPAILFAAAHPERVKALVLGNTQARWAADDDYTIGIDPSSIDDLVEMIESTWGTPEGLAIVLPGLSNEDESLRLLSRLCRAAATPRTAGALYRYIFSELDVRDALPLIQAPTLVIHNGSADASRSQYLADHIDDARLVGVPGGDALFFGGDIDPVIREVAEFLTGHRPPVNVDRVLTTVLFTDIVGSTERAASEGDSRWRDLLDAHDRAVRVELSHFRGKEIKTTGDGFLAAFDGPARAIHCAQAIAKATKSLGLGVRSGLHTGECEVRGDDLAGLAVHIAARVGAMAGPDEVLVSSTVKDLVAGSGISFEERGEHDLKGVPDQWRLFAVST